MESLSNSPAAVIGSVVIGYLISNWIFGSKKNHAGNIPKVAGGLPLLGHAVAYGADPAGFLLRCKKQYGSAFQIKMLLGDFVFVDGTYKRAYFAFPETTLSFTEAMLKALVPDHVFGSKDPILNPWHTPIIKRHFSIKAMMTSSAFTMTRIDMQVKRVLDADLAGALKEGESTVMDNPQMLAWRIIASCSASSFLGDEISKRKGIIDTFIKFHEACFHVISMGNLLPASMLWLVARSVKEHNKVIRAAVIPEVERRRALVQANKDVDLPEDILTTLIKTDRTAEDIAERMMAFILSSMITSAGTMTNALYDLAGRQEQWDALLKEQKSVLDEHGPSLSQPALEAMPRLHAFVWESMRLAALPIQQTRLVMKEGVELAPGLCLPQGAMVCISGVMDSVDEEIFDRAAEFVPERFLVDNALTPEPEKLGFYPFGIGKHLCPGRHFALAEVKGALVVLLRNYRFKTVSGNVPAYKHTPIESSRIKEPVQFTRTTAAW